ncbi:hypothetical protein [Labrys sp. ZIDIC5]|uniref:hypothetical protein n=1 Tax=Labrys sedimenti TaxID=3106036 RepID=UPI002ACAF5AD|nr:hypothetical protein [Labrys sp. ZIDIC5]MDZ5451824.1 hypothetical protein [Labrys sp. ZIDIC5]
MPASRAAEPARLARTIGLVLIVFFAAQGISAAVTTQRASMGALFLCAYVHVGISLYDGLFPRWRRASWVVFILAFLCAQILALAGYGAPWNKCVLRLSAEYEIPESGTPLWRSELIQFLDVPWEMPALVAAVAAALFLVLDLLVMLMSRDVSLGIGKGPSSTIRSSQVWQAVLVLAFVAIVGIITSSSRGSGHMGSLFAYPTTPTGNPHTPQWWLLPYYSLLQGGQGRIGGGVVAICATLVLLALPWLRTDRCRFKPVLVWFGVACGLCALCWIGLGWLGNAEPDDATVWQGRLLAFCYFAIFLAALPILSVWARRLQDDRISDVLKTFD